VLDFRRAMKQIGEFVDERQKTWCVHCGRGLGRADVSQDHVPSKSLLIAPYPKNLPRIAVCKQCNEGFSLDEEYMIALLSSVLSGTTDPQRQFIPSAACALARSEKLRERVERAQTVSLMPTGETRRLWVPEVKRIERVVLKNARGHAFFEYGEPMLDGPKHVWFKPTECMTVGERNDFEHVESRGIWPEVGSRMLTRVVTGSDLVNGWIVVQPGIYRYSVVQSGRMLVRGVLYEYLATEVQWDDG
jgi:hypothetical protein